MYLRRITTRSKLKSFYFRFRANIFTFIFVNLYESVKISSNLVSRMHGFHFGSASRSNETSVQVCFASHVALVFGEVCHAIVCRSTVRFSISVGEIFKNTFSIFVCLRNIFFYQAKRYDRIVK